MGDGSEEIGYYVSDILHFTLFCGKDVKDRGLKRIKLDICLKNF